MPLPTSQGLFVTFSLNKCRLVVVVAVLAAIFSADIVSAQSPFRLPFLAPSRPSVLDGAFYMSGGVKFRNLNTVTMRAYDSLRHSFTNKFLSPTIEVGYQESNFFDVFAGFSWYDVSNAYTMNVPATFPGAGGIAQAINYHLRFEVYELRAGGRSWFPLWGMGRIATTLAVATSVLPFKVDVTRTTANTLEEGHNSDWWLRGAVIGGVEMELDYGRWFLKTAAEYSVGNEVKYESLLGTRTEVNPMGFGLVLQSGFRF